MSESASLSHAQLRRRRGRPFRVEAYRGLLERVSILRVLTAEQARWLHRPWREKTERNARARLAQLVTEGYLQAQPYRPPKGRASSHFYQLTHRALGFLGQSPSSSLLARPAQHVLDYLVLRNEVWAQLRAEGYEVASPLLLDAAHHPKALKVVETWAVLQGRKELARLKAQSGVSPDALSRAEQDIRRIPLFAPKALTWDFAYRLNAKHLPDELLLVVVDDPRRQVSRRSGKAPARPSKSRPQLEGLPPPGFAGDRLLLRDSESRWSVKAARLSALSKRLIDWRAALTQRYGRPFLATDTLLPDLWAHRIAAPPPSHHQQQHLKDVP